MLGDAPLSLREFVMHEPLPVATIQAAVFEFLRDRRDCAVFGSQSVNAYVSEQRSTEDIDIESTRAEELAEELRRFLNEKFYIAVRVRSVRGGIGFRVYQVRKPENRHLIDVRPVPELSPVQIVDEVQIVAPHVAIANKVQSIESRKGKPKALTDARDLMHLLMTFPDLQTPEGPVRDRLVANGADAEVLAAWDGWAARVLEPEDPDDEFDY
ncbi:MAG: hypothetical protein AAF710_10855 [Planctomycetota bacterium]